MEWRKLNSFSDIPKDGTRMLIGSYGKTFAQKEHSNVYEINALFNIDIMLFDWTNPDLDLYCIKSLNDKLVDYQWILDRYSIYFIIEIPTLEERKALYAEIVKSSRNKVF